jgi:hypothetical protein
MAGRAYTRDEADAILARALEMHGRGEATSHEDLVAAAREVGVPPEAIEKAAAEILAQRRDEQELAELRARSWRGFFAHLIPYLMVSALLVFLNVMTGGWPWALIVMLGWGVGLASHLFAVAMPDPARLRRRIERRRLRERGRDSLLHLATHVLETHTNPGRLRVASQRDAVAGKEAEADEAGDSPAAQSATRRSTD